MKTLWALPVSLALVAGLIIPTNIFAAEHHFFDDLTGNWRGKGFVISSVGAKEEAVRCRLLNRKDKKIAKLFLTGNCSVGGVLIPMNGWLKQTGTSKKYSASLFKSLAFLRVDKFTGGLRGKRLKLNFVGRDKVSKEDIAIYVTIAGKNENRFDILLSGTDQKTKKPFKIGTIVFSRK
ncbi:MAG: hypothetical protein L3J32_06280 [Rhizobiaceae bacterium]|nr:hypothetical protein [Rhizobiaceae bacterium]